MQEQNETNLSRAPAWRAFRAAAPQTLPVFAGYLVLGLGYGIYVQSLGLPVWLPPLMGTVVYGGSQVRWCTAARWNSCWRRCFWEALRRCRPF